MSNNKVQDFLVTLCVELVVSWMKTCVVGTATNSLPEKSTRSRKINVVSSLPGLYEGASPYSYVLPTR